MLRIIFLLILLLVFAPIAAQEEFVNWLFFETQNCIQTMYDADTGTISTFVEGCYLRWSLNGEFYTFTRSDGIHIQTVAHDEIALYTEFSEKVIYHTPHWITNNHLMVAAADSDMDACSWYILDTTTQEANNLEVENNHIPCVNVQLRLSPSGHYVLLSNDVFAGIYILDTEDWSGQYLEDVYGGTWSPIDDTILISVSDNGVRNVYKMEFPGNNLSQLTFNQNPSISPIWSPDGTRIAYVEDTMLNLDIHILELNTNEDVKLDVWGMDCDYFYCIQWSTNGHAILYWYHYESEIQQDAVFVDGTERGCPICSTIYFASPNNCYEAYLSPEDDRLSIRYTPDNEVTQLTETSINFSSLQWRPQPNAAKEC